MLISWNGFFESRYKLSQFIEYQFFLGEFLNNVGAFFNIIWCQTDQRPDPAYDLFFILLERLLKIFKVNTPLTVQFALHKSASNILFHIGLIWLFGKSDILWEPMLLEESNCPIISKGKYVLNTLMLTEILEFVHE